MNQGGIAMVKQDAVNELDRVIVPNDDEWFDLMVDYNAVQTREYVRLSGYDPCGWRFAGHHQRGKELHRVKLVRIPGFISVKNNGLAEELLEQMGYRVADAAARESFAGKYQWIISGDFIFFGRSPWEDKRGRRPFASLCPDSVWRCWCRGFRWDFEAVFERCRWVVESK